MNLRNATAAAATSPLITPQHSEWSGIDRYGNDTDSFYSPSTATSRGRQPSIGTMNGSRYSPARNPRDTSPSASIGRLSSGTTHPSYNGSDSGRAKKDEHFEGTLSDHYVALRRYLAASLRDKGNLRPNKAQDKLLRLSPVQFQELSTDVYDELQRRQSSARRTPNGSIQATPAFLPPEKAFHPKRNQARQKLSSLPPPRFRDLATDVFYELERRFPKLAAGDISRMGSPASIRGPPSRNGNGTPGPDSRSSRRRPSDAMSTSSYGPRSESRNGGLMVNSPSDVPPSPALPPNSFGRPTPKTLQQNTIVPNKSTMIEDDVDDDDDGEGFIMQNMPMDEGNRTNSVDSGVEVSDKDKKLILDYKAQVAELREKSDVMGEKLRQKDEELNNLMNMERNRSTASNLEKKEWDELRMHLENELADAQALHNDLRQELDRVRTEFSNMERDMSARVQELQESNRELAAQADKLRANASLANAAKGARDGRNSLVDADLERENRELRRELEEQQIVTEEVRKEAQEFLREMRVLSEQGGASWQRQAQLEEQVNRLEEEVKDWRNRYARTKTQLRSVRASSIGLTIQHDAAKSAKENGFTEADGMVKDVHITKYQISIDELLQIARKDHPERVTEYMKNVVANVRRITQDIEENGKTLGAEQTKLRGKVSATANNLITAAKNFAHSGGISPVSLLDAAASHLTAAVVELVRTVKIRPTPAGELEDDDDGHLSPDDPPGLALARGRRDSGPGASVPAFTGMSGLRTSAESSMYSPVDSPRESSSMGRPKSSNRKNSWRSREPSMRPNGSFSNGASRNPHPPAPMAFGIRQQNNDVEDLKIYLEDQTAFLVQNIQGLVGSIRAESPADILGAQIGAIAAVVARIVAATEAAMRDTGLAELRDQGAPVLARLDAVQRRLVRAGEEGTAAAAGGDAFRRWAAGLPPLAFEIARETKELVQRVEGVDVALMGGGGPEDFS